METVNAGQAKDRLFNLLEEVNKDHLPRMITSKKGDAILLSKEDWESLQETLYLQSVPGLVESIKETEQADDWVSEEDFFKALDGLEN